MGNAAAVAYNKNGIKREKGLYLFIYLNGEKVFRSLGWDWILRIIISYSYLSK
jgi:hypothetical protein